MSLIAKSLKKLQSDKRKRDSYFFGKVRFSHLGGLPVYIVMSSIAVFFLGVYSFDLFKVVNAQIKKDFSFEVYKIEREIKTEELAIHKEISKKPQTLEYLLQSGDLAKMGQIAEKENNIKYLGIYYVETSNPEKGVSLLELYLKNHNDNQAKMYLALAYLKEKRYLDALNELEKIKSNRYEVFLDKAVVLEKLGLIKNAIQNYEIAYDRSKDPVVKGMIKAKITVLRFVR